MAVANFGSMAIWKMPSFNNSEKMALKVQVTVYSLIAPIKILMKPQFKLSEEKGY